jgi:lipopolysaccharide export system protein LptA
MDHAGATLEANQLDAYFSKSTPGQPSELKRAVATGSVTVVEPGRRAAGDRAEYFAADGRIELSGGPPMLYDTEKGFTTGRVLTFFTGSDSLQVDGGQGSRALSKHRLSQ